MDIDFRKKCLDMPEFGIYRNCVHTINGFVYCNNKSIDNYNNSLKILHDMSIQIPLEYQEFGKILSCTSHNRVRLKKRITDMFKIALMTELSLLFVTFTFTEKILNNTSSNTRRQHVFRYLNSHCFNKNCSYVANIDYGDVKPYIDDNGVEKVSTGREHYHALILTSRLDLGLYKYGRIRYKKVRVGSIEKIDNSSIRRLTKYILKLTNHALKNSTKNNRVIYSRNFDNSLTKDFDIKEWLVSHEIKEQFNNFDNYINFKQFSFFD